MKFLNKKQTVQLLISIPFAFLLWWGLLIPNANHIIGKITIPFFEVSDENSVLVISDAKGEGGRYEGFFSCFNAALAAIVQAKKYGYAGLELDYTSPILVEPSLGSNWWDYYFNSTIVLNTEKQNFWKLKRRRMMLQNSILYDDNNMFPYRTLVPRKVLNQYINDYIPIKKNILDRVQQFQDKHFSDNFNIGVHFRGTDNSMTLVKYIPYTRYKQEVDEAIIMHASRLQNKEYKIFVAADEIDFVEMMSKWYEGRVVYQENIPRLKKGDKTGVHKSNFTHTEVNESVLLDSLLLSRCDYLIKTRSSVSSTSLLFNPHINFTFIEPYNLTQIKVTA